MTVRQVGIRLKTDGKAEVKRDFQEIAKDGKAAGQAIVGGMDAGATSLDKAAKAVDRQTAKWQAMAKAAKEAAVQQEHIAASNAKLDAILGLGGSGKSAAESAQAFGVKTLTKQEAASRLNLLRQAADVAVTAPTMNPAMIALQQGPQILDALATSGIKVAPVLLGVGAAVGTIGAALAVAAVSQAKYEASVVALEVATQGLGRASGITAEGVQRQAEAAAEASGITASAAREFAAEYVATGKIGQGVLQDLVGLTKDYAVTTRQDAAGATKELAAAFASPAKGAADLNDKLHFLRTAELEHIENLARGGREAEAQAYLVDKLKGSLLDATDATTGWGHAADSLKQKWMGVWEWVGKAVDRAATGGSAADRLAQARQDLVSANQTLKLNPQDSGALAMRRTAQAEIDRQYADYVKEMNGQRTAALSQQDSDRRELVDRYNPDAGKLRKAKADRDNLIRLGTPDAESKEALADLNKEIAALEKGYKSAAAAASALAKANRAAAKDARQDAREAAEAKRKADDLDLRRLRDDVTTAKAGGDASAIAAAELQLRLREMIIQRERDSVKTADAKLEAEKQISKELLAQYAAILNSNSNREFDKQGFVSSEDRMAKANAAIAGPDFKAFSAKSDFFEKLTSNTRDAFNDGLVAGASGGSFLSVFISRLKSAAATAFADMATDGLFGRKDGTKSGLISLAMKAFIPGFAKGVFSSPDGVALVGEKGPELVDLPGGSRVFTADETRRLTSAGQAAMAPAAPAINVTYAPTIDARGAGPREVDVLRAQMERDRAEFADRTIAVILDAKSRRVAGV